MQIYALYNDGVQYASIKESRAEMYVQYGTENKPIKRSLKPRPQMKIFVAVLSLWFIINAMTTSPLPKTISGISIP
jgi:hypothetical protein